MGYYLNAVVILMTFNLVVNCSATGPKILEWGVENYFCGKSIPVIMGLLCKIPQRYIPADDTIDQKQGVRVRRGIVDDCCTTPCTPKYMQTYCGEQEIDNTDQPTIKDQRKRRSPTLTKPKQINLTIATTPESGTTTTTEAPTFRIPDKQAICDGPMCGQFL